MADQAGPGRTHECPGGCGRRDVALEKFACPSCWFRLPRTLKKGITQTYRLDRAQHAEAMRAAIDWYAAHRPAEPAPGEDQLTLGDLNGLYGSCAECGQPYAPDHDPEAPDATVSHPFTPHPTRGSQPR
ncbi:MAG: hypothetical protein JWO98_2070 [Frankiales bacterium]|nr:hypothetical protein [Frankiales bacterium]